MKPFQGTDLTNDKKNRKANGAEFLVAQPSAAMALMLEESMKAVEEMEGRAKLPKALRVLQWSCGIIGAVIFVGIAKSLGGVTLEQGYHNAPAFFWVAGIALAMWGVLKLIGMKKSRTVLESDEGIRIASRLESVKKAALGDLNIPDNARDVDILSFFYREKRGKIKPCEKGIQMATHFNTVYQLFVDDENLYLANLSGKYAFPLSAIRGIRTIKKQVRFAEWNKAETWNTGIYKQYKMSRDQYGCIHVKPCYILELEQNGERWGIHFPAYELPVFEHYTGKKPEEN